MNMINTSLCYIEKDGCYLMLHRTKKLHDYNHDKWIGIGGKFENGESPEDCVIREVKEETGLTLDIEGLEYKGIVTFVCDDGKCVGEVDGDGGCKCKDNCTVISDKNSVCENVGNIEKKSIYTECIYTEFMHIFHCTKFSGNIISCNEGDLEWIPIEKMNELPHWKGDEIFLDFLKTQMPFYSLKLEYRNGELKKSFLNGKEYNHWQRI